MITLVLARRGHGKSWLARHLASQWSGPVYCHDPMAEHPWPLIDEADPDVLLSPGTLLVLDEIDLIAPPSGYAAPWLREAVHYGRHYGVSIIGCARRPANVHRDLSALAARVYLGRITEPRDLRYCVHAWGEICLQARTIPPRRFLEIDP